LRLKTAAIVSALSRRSAGTEFHTDGLTTEKARFANSVLVSWRRGVVVNTLVSINVVAQHRARLLLGWVTVYWQVNRLGNGELYSLTFNLLSYVTMAYVLDGRFEAYCYGLQLT